LKKQQLEGEDTGEGGRFLECGASLDPECRALKEKTKEDAEKNDPREGRVSLTSLLEEGEKNARGGTFPEWDLASRDEEDGREREEETDLLRESFIR